LPCIVNKRLDSPLAHRRNNARRLVVATLLATAAWTFFLTHSRWLFSGDEPVTKRRPDPIDVQLVELPQPQPQSQQAAASNSVSAKPRQATSRPPARPVTRQPRVVERQPEVAHPPPEKRDIARPTPQPAPETAQQTPASPPATPAQPVQTADARPAASNASSSAAEQPTPGHSDAPASGPARVVAQPLPELPDDLREEGYQFVAMARFVIHADGTFDVQLIKPTPNPRLNQLLIVTLRKWRFAPATESGHPVESHQDVRVHFNVN
jgi:periplasmic protein TonB